jgi:transposase-like protein
MLALTCRRCGSVNLRKNGRTKDGRQQVHCKDCNFYSTLDTLDAQRAEQRATAERLYLERLSQRAIARITGLSRSTVSAIVKKSLDTACGNHHTAARAANPRD